jgi:5-methylcytosine-specific restriction endonuclease McrA
MLTCKVCLKQFQTLRFQSPRVCVCGRCTNDLNKYKEVAEDSYRAARELLLVGMLRRATIEVSSAMTPFWKQQSAERILENLEVEVDRALPEWINKLVADKSNRTKIFKIIRAHRRGLLHLDRPHRWGYPNNWKEIAHNIRKLDNFACVSCSANGVELHVHHIVYVSNFGTHQKTNLVTLCRTCHEKEHERVFDFGENMLTTDVPPLT